MFRKPFSVKSNVNMRNSDMKKLFSRISEDIKGTFAKGAKVAHVRLTTHNDIAVSVYTVDKQPLFFEFDYSSEKMLFPSVYATWLSQEAYPIVVVHEQVIGFLENGADLMMQGILRTSEIGLPCFPRGCPVVVCSLKGDCLTGPLAVGCALLSSDEMISSGMKGRGLQILHVDKDHLWELGNRQQAPSMSFSEIIKKMEEEAIALEAEENERTKQQDVEIPSVGELTIESASEEEDILSPIVDEISGDGQADSDNQESPEDLALRCFLAGLKYRMTKNAALPFDVGQFYSQCLLPCVPAGRRLDMKKTKYKKFASFLDELNKGEHGPLLTIGHKAKGVDVISAVNWEHPLLKSFKVKDERIADETEKSDKPGVIGPRVHEMLSITEPILPLVRTFRKANKGDIIDVAVLREGITAYVKAQNLNSGKSVKLDPLLAGLIKSSADTIEWNTLHQKIQSLATATFVIELPDKRTLTYKLKIPRINLKVENRAGNKKVTIINNCEVFGLEARELAHRCQVGVAASASIQDSPEPFKGSQITLQGSQIPYVSALLQNEYGVDKKYIDGFDLGSKKKKK